MIELPTIPNYVFIILLAVVTGYSTFLTAKGGLTNNSFKRYWDRLTRRGRSVFYSLLTIAILLLLQELNAQVKTSRKEDEVTRESVKKDSILAKERDQRDSTITARVRAGIDSNSKKLFDDVSKAFAKQEFRLDTVKKEVVRISEYAKADNSQPIPIIHIDSVGIFPISRNGNKYKYGLSFRSYEAAATNFDLNCYGVLELSGKTYHVEKIVPITKEIRIPKNGKWTADFEVETALEIINIYLYIKGKCTTIDGAKPSYIEDLYIYETKTDRVNTIMQSSWKKEILTKITSVYKES